MNTPRNIISEEANERAPLLRLAIGHEASSTTKHDEAPSATMTLVVFPINSVFVTGMTICYIVTRNPALWTPARANDLRVCSSSLFAVAERNPAVRKYCDMLDTIIEAISEYAEQVSTSFGGFKGPQSSMGSPAEEASPRDAFDRLGVSLKELKFEFPSHSYPTYRFKDDESQPVCGTEVWSNLAHSGSIQWDSLGLDHLDPFLFTDN